MTRRFSLLFVLGLAFLVLTACGGTSGSGGAPSNLGTEAAASQTLVTETATETESEVVTQTSETEEAETEEAKTEAATETRPPSFSGEVLPIFQANCSGCHGNSGGLNLASYETLMAGGRRGAVIVPGDAESSRLVQYVQSGRMPAGGDRLSDAEIQKIVDWVNAGAPNN